MTTYVRFRADPSKIRIGIMRNGPLWTVTMTRLDYPMDIIRYTARDPKYVVDQALRQAELCNWKGIDLGCGGAYEHPWK